MLILLSPSRTLGRPHLLKTLASGQAKQLIEPREKQLKIGRRAARRQVMATIHGARN